MTAAPSHAHLIFDNGLDCEANLVDSALGSDEVLLVADDTCASVIAGGDFVVAQVQDVSELVLDGGVGDTVVLLNSARLTVLDGEILGDVFAFGDASVDLGGATPGEVFVRNLEAHGSSHVEVDQGASLDTLAIREESSARITGGRINRVAMTGKAFRVEGGEIDRISGFDPSILQVLAEGGEQVEFVGRDFHLNGLEVTPVLPVLGGTNQISGTLAGGGWSRVTFSEAPDDAMRFTAAEPPALILDSGASETITSDPYPGDDLSLRNGTRLELFAGGSIDSVYAEDVSELILRGGAVWGSVVARADARVTMHDGVIERHLALLDDSEARIVDGELGRHVEVFDNAQLRLEGGTFSEKMTVAGTGRVIVDGSPEFPRDGNADITALGAATIEVVAGSVQNLSSLFDGEIRMRGGTANLLEGRIEMSGGSAEFLRSGGFGVVRMFGGQVGLLRASSGDNRVYGGIVSDFRCDFGKTTIYGGTIRRLNARNCNLPVFGGKIEESLGVDAGAEVELYGRDFEIDGTPVTGTTTSGVYGHLTGVLSSGEAIDVDLVEGLANFGQGSIHFLERSPEPLSPADGELLVDPTAGYSLVLDDGRAARLEAPGHYVSAELLGSSRLDLVGGTLGGSVALNGMASLVMTGGVLSGDIALSDDSSLLVDGCRSFGSSVVAHGSSRIDIVECSFLAAFDLRDASELYATGNGVAVPLLLRHRASAHLADGVRVEGLEVSGDARLELVDGALAEEVLISDRGSLLLEDSSSYQTIELIDQARFELRRGDAYRVVARGQSGGTPVQVRLDGTASYLSVEHGDVAVSIGGVHSDVSLSASTLRWSGGVLTGAIWLCDDSVLEVHGADFALDGESAAPGLYELAEYSGSPFLTGQLASGATVRVSLTCGGRLHIVAADPAATPVTADEYVRVVAGSWNEEVYALSGEAVLELEAGARVFEVRIAGQSRLTAEPDSRILGHLFAGDRSSALLEETFVHGDVLLSGEASLEMREGWLHSDLIADERSSVTLWEPSISNPIEGRGSARIDVEGGRVGFVALFDEAELVGRGLHLGRVALHDGARLEASDVLASSVEASGTATLELHDGRTWYSADLSFEGAAMGSLQNFDVSGGIRLAEDASLETFGGVVEGDFRLEDRSIATAVGTAVRGDIHLEGASRLELDEVPVSGAIRVEADATLVIAGGEYKVDGQPLAPGVHRGLNGLLSGYSSSGTRWLAKVAIEGNLEIIDAARDFEGLSGDGLVVLDADSEVENPLVATERVTVRVEEGGLLGSALVRDDARLILEGGDADGDVSVRNRAKVTLEAGWIDGNVIVEDEATLSVLGGGVSYWIVGMGEAVVEILGGKILETLYGFGHALIRVASGAVHEVVAADDVAYRQSGGTVSSLSALDRADLELSAGSIELLTAEDDSAVFLSGTDVAKAIVARDRASLAMSNGAVDDLILNDSSRFSLVGGQLGFVTTRNLALFEMSGGSVDDLTSTLSSRVALTGGVVLGPARVEWKSSLLVDGGRVEGDVLASTEAGVTVSSGALGLLELRNRSRAEIEGGTLDSLHTRGKSSVRMYGGRVGELRAVMGSTATVVRGEVVTGVEALGNAELQILGGTITGRLTADSSKPVAIVGRDFMVSGVPVPDGELEAVSGRLRGTLSDGGSINVLFERVDGAVIAVPEPAAGAMALAALCALGLLRRPLARRGSSRRAGCARQR